MDFPLEWNILTLNDLSAAHEHIDPMPLLHHLTRLSLLAGALSLPLKAGSYSQNFTGFDSGTTNLGDGSEISSNNGAASVRGNSSRYLRLTSNSQGGTSSAFKIPDLDPGKIIESFTANFDLLIGGSGTLADGASLTFGAIPAGYGGGEGGFAAANNLIIAWDTYPNGGEQPSIEVFANNTSIFNLPFSFSSIANSWVAVEINWDADGLDLKVDGNTITNNLATPGFVPGAGDRFAFSGRTGGATQNTYLDDLVLSTSTASPIETGGPVISEFVADNDDSYEDGELDSPDWLEIYNGQDATLNLGGYHLTTDPTHTTLWEIPAISFEPYEYFLIFASGKDRTDPSKPLHTNFTLQREGGYLALLAPDGTTVVSAFTYDQQEEDIAFGELGAARTIGYLETPTPGTQNSGLQADGPPAEDAQFDRTGGLFFGSTTLTIFPPVSPTAIVRYTTDGTVPNEDSPVYSSAFNITDTTTIRARVFEPNRLPGEIKSRTLLERNSSLSGFSSNLPIVVIDSDGVDIDAASNPSSPRPFRPVYTVVIDRSEVDGLARIDDLPDFTGRGGMHVRGQSSSGFPKKQYAWETWTNEDQDKDVTILGLPSESDWILQAPYSDKTLMRNAVVYEAARELNGSLGGVRTRYVEVFFNKNGGTVSSSDYRGVYVLMEKIKRDKERVDVEKLNDLVTDPELIKGGYIFKKDKPPHSRSWNSATEGILFDTHYPEYPNDTQFEFLTNHVDEMESVLHSGNFDDPVNGYAAYLDIPSFIDAHLTVETFKNIDGYRISTYFSKPRNGKIFALPVWDYNLGLGNANYLQGENPQGWYYPQTSSSDYYWYPRLFQDQEFELNYWDRFWELRRSLFSDAGMLSLIDRHDAELDGNQGTPNAVTRNFDEWNILGTYLWPNAAGYASRTTHQSEVDWMKNWLTQRLDWMETQSRGTNGLARPPSFNQYGGEVPGNFQLTMTNPNGWAGAQIYFTTDGSDPRVSQVNSTTLVGEDAACQALVPSTTNGGDTLTVADWTNPTAPPNAGEWISGQQGVGYERSTSDFYDPYINLDVNAVMAGRSQTCYIRIPFTIASQAEIDALAALTLKMRYDDSFVAYLNGQEIVREANAPASLLYNSGAEAGHGDSEAIQYLDFPANAGLAHLRVGDNMLAIHGLNESLGSSDALWSAILVGSTGIPNAPSASAQTYSSALDLGNSTEIKARVYDGSKWSPLTSGSFFVDTIPASADNLVISEINYRPSAPTQAETDAGFNSRGKFEYLELTNIHPVSSISLEGITFTDGITFAGFTNDLPVDALILAPGDRVVLVDSAEAFALRYGDSGATIAGVFSGALSNDGEQITLLDASGLVIKDFTYDEQFPWPVSSGDGSGYALSLVDPSSNPDHNNPLSWRSSVTVDGTPGRTDIVPFTGAPDVDGDGDGLSAFLEYAMGSSDDNSTDLALLNIQFQPLEVDGLASSYLVVEIPVSLSASGISYTVQSSEDLNTWTSIPGLTHIGTTNLGNGRALRTYRSNLEANQLPPGQFYRVQVAR